MQRIKRMLKDNYRKFCGSVTLIQLLIIGIIVILSFYPTYHLLISIHHEMAFAIAKGAGSTLKYLLICIFFPTLRMFNAKIHQYFPRLANVPLLGSLFYYRMHFHRMIGWAFLIFSLIHTLAHIIRHSVLLMSLGGLTGIAMLLAISLPIGAVYLLNSYQSTSHSLLKNKSFYNKFILPHQLGWWCLVIAFGIHTYDLRLLTWSLSIFTLFSLDRLWEWFQSRNVKITKIEKIHHSMIMIEVEKPLHYYFKTGQKAYLSYPPESAFINNLHPFTIASSPSEKKLRFIISDNGEWSHLLIKTLKQKMTIRISPAFPTPLDIPIRAGKSDEKLLISSGSGLAIIIAHLFNQKEKTPLKIIHSTRHKEEITFINEAIRKSGANVISSEFHLTSNGYESRLRKRKEPLHARTTSERFQPSNNPILNMFKGRVYYCGNDCLGDAIEATVAKDHHKILMREKYSL